MRAIAFTVIFTIYILSGSLWLVDVMFAAPLGYEIRGIDGEPIDTLDLLEDPVFQQIYNIDNQTLNPEQDGLPLNAIGSFLETGYTSVWTLLNLLGGSFFFDTLEAIGIPSPFVFFMRIIFPILVAFNVVWFLVGRY